jgi:ADP-ribose pyrophosphatase
MSTEAQHWKTLGQELLVSAPPWLSLYRERVELPSGRVIDDFYRIVLPDFVSIVPVTEAGDWVMVRGYKHGLGRVTLTPPAGLIEPGETPLAAAQRELLEETGYTAERWKPLGHFVVDGNRQCGTMHVFLATGACRVQEAQEDDSEALRIEHLNLSRVIAALSNGEIGNLAGAGAAALALAIGG